MSSRLHTCARAKVGDAFTITRLYLFVSNPFNGDARDERDARLDNLTLRTGMKPFVYSAHGNISLIIVLV